MQPGQGFSLVGDWSAITDGSESSQVAAASRRHPTVSNTCLLTGLVGLHRGVGADQSSRDMGMGGRSVIRNAPIFFLGL